MNEQEQVSQLSALFDGELPPRQAEMVIRRALRDEASRASWERYALIGACLRSEPLLRGHGLADRVQATLAGERDHNISVLPERSGRQAARDARFGGSWLGRGALGGAVAAGVALVSIIVVRAIAPLQEPASMLAATDAGARPAVIAAVPESEPSYTTPGTNSPAQHRRVEASLGHYLVAHSEGAASALRSSLDLEGGEALTEDQISALR